MEERKILIDVLTLLRRSLGQDNKNLKPIEYIYGLWANNQDFFKEHQNILYSKHYKRENRHIPFELFYSYYMMSELLKKTGIDVSRISKTPLILVANSG